MKRARFAARVAVALGVVAAPVVVAATANAGPYNTSPITASSSQPAPGSQLQITASGFKPNSTVQIFIHSTPVLLATVTADANGVVNASVRIPDGLAAGSSHQLLAQGEDPSGKAITDTLNVTIAGGSSLPFTGVDAIGVAAAGAGLVGFGSFLVFASRRKRAARLG